MIKKIRSSIGLKTFISMSALLILCCVIIYGLVLYFLPRNYQSELEEQFTGGFHDLIARLEQSGVTENAQLITDFSVQNNASVKITDDTGNTIISIKSAAENSAVDTDILNKVRAFTIQSEFWSNGQRHAITATASFVAVAQSYDVLLRLLPLIAIVILVISTLAAFLCSCFFSKPLVDICGVSRRMANLDMTWKCDTGRTDEIGVLAVNLNEMSQKLADALSSLQTANEQLQKDIEKERRQEKQRVDFFTAVSHELKTPITIIKGELEGMIYQVGEYKNRDTYLRHLLKMTEVMEKLVKEILSAAKMGRDDFKLNMTDIDISRLIEKTCRELQGLAEDKQIIMALDVQPSLMYRGDKQLLKKALSNIIGNAVFHSLEQAAITVLLKGNILTVENTGVHLSGEETKQLFMPFYRVDKSHNRNTGGSGLGLYIVKTILDRHSLEYSIGNSEQSVCFKIIFK